MAGKFQAECVAVSSVAGSNRATPKNETSLVTYVLDKKQLKVVEKLRDSSNQMASEARQYFSIMVKISEKSKIRF